MSHAGAFNAFDKDGDGIIKLNVLQVRKFKAEMGGLFLVSSRSNNSVITSQHIVIHVI